MVYSQGNLLCDNDCHEPILEFYQQNMLNIDLSCNQNNLHDCNYHLLFEITNKRDKQELAYSKKPFESLLTGLDMINSNITTNFTC